MSTRKDGIKISNRDVPKKRSSNSTKISTTNRENSTDRNGVKKTEAQVKRKTLPLVKETEAESKEKSKRAPTHINTKNLKATSQQNVRKPATKKESSHSKVKRPTTPPSARVSKSQYFPSKNLYSNALKTTKGNENLDSTRSSTINNIEKSQISTKTIKTIRKDHNKSKTNTPKEELHNEASSDTSSMSERPRTATLRKGSIVNHNIVGPEVSKPITKLTSPTQKSDASDDYKYEDDFESYESDFEAYSSSSSTSDAGNISAGDSSSTSISDHSNFTSPRELQTTIQKRVNSAGTDDERKLDSGNFELPDYKHKHILDNIRESIEKENAAIAYEAGRNNTASLSDEGFEDGKSLQFINFLGAQKKYEHRKSMELKRRRGEEILSMIRLDTYSFTLFDLPPVPYEIFIKSFGNNNMVQVSAQTGEDNLSEETQTDNILTNSRWTQVPTKFSTMDPSSDDFWNIYKSDFLGVGNDEIVEELVEKDVYKEYALNKFLSSAGNLILQLQSEDNIPTTENVNKNSRDLAFSDGYVSLNTELECLRDCKISLAYFCDNHIVSVHIKKKFFNSDSYQSLICTWNLSNLEEPECILGAYGNISCCTMDTETSNIVFAGTQEGSILVWNLKDRGPKVPENAPSRKVTSPWYSSPVGSCHVFKIVAIKSLVTKMDTKFYFHNNSTKEIYTLDEEGEIIIWSVIINKSKTFNFCNTNCYHQEIKLLKNSHTILKTVYPELSQLQCTNLATSPEDPNRIYIATNYGYIIHYLFDGSRTNVKKFLPGFESEATCLEICPFSQNYLLSGHGNGNIVMYSNSVKKPLIVLSNKEETGQESSIELIQWSHNQPFTIYTKDSLNIVHIWNLKESDLYPSFSIPFEDIITCMKLSSTSNSSIHSNEKSFMVIGTYNGQLTLHMLNSEHGKQSIEAFENDRKTFLNYVSRL